MRTLTHVEYYESRSQTFTLYQLTDLHLGARACAEKLLKADIEAIAADPFARWIGGGDYIEAIGRNDEKRHKQHTLAAWCKDEEDIIGVQRDRAIDYLAPIIGKCWGLVDGNHERYVLNHEKRDIYWELVAMLARIAGKKPQALALGVQGFVEVTFRRGNAKDYGGSWKMDIYTHHGYGSSRRKGGHVTQLESLMSDYDADLYLVGHRHSRAFTDKYIVQPHMKQRYRMGLQVPSYLAAYIEPSTEERLTDTYIEQSAMPPQHLGTVPITIKPDVRRFAVTLTSAIGIQAASELHIIEGNQETRAIA